MARIDDEADAILADFWRTYVPKPLLFRGWNTGNGEVTWMGTRVPEGWCGFANKAGASNRCFDFSKIEMLQSTDIETLAYIRAQVDCPVIAYKPEGSK